jgi:lactate dehydrogenase-like 2-hydroxyacid dehydrogenase
MKSDITILQATDLPDHTVKRLADHFSVLRLPEDPAEHPAFFASNGSKIRAIACTGKGPVSAAMIESLPALEIISSFSAGIDGIDVEAAAARGIPVANTSHALAEDVADIALWLLLSVARGTVQSDRFVRAGKWPNGDFPLTRSIGSMKVGIVGLGHIGKALARRLEVMKAEISYHGRSRKSDTNYAYYASLPELASWCDALVVCCPGGDETRNLVDAKIISAVGPDGWIVNISRGTVVDEPALVAALSDGRIAGAGLDVFLNEPTVPREMLDDERVVLLPHVGSATAQTRTAMGAATVEALVSHFAR